MDSLKSKEVLNIMRKCHEIKMSRKQMTIVKCSKFEIDEVNNECNQWGKYFCPECNFKCTEKVFLKFSRKTTFRTILAIQLTL